jgi:YHS domain-containing protein
MQVEVLHAPATVVRDGTTTYFCSDHCATRFRADPGRFERGRAGAPAAPAVEPGASAQRIELGREP